MHSRKGFSTIEMLVATALFSAIVLLCISSMIVLIDANQKTRSVKTAMDNLGFALDDMVRDLRLGTRFFCVPATAPSLPSSIAANSQGQDCQYSISNDATGGFYLAFRNKEGNAVFYYFDNANKTLKRKTTSRAWSLGYSGANNVTTVDGYGNAFVTLSSSDIVIERFRFYVYNADTFGTQPYVTIAAKVKVGPNAKPKLQTTFSVQTTVSQRVPNNAE